MTTTTSSNKPTKWKATNMSSQRGKVTIVTGANSGIGFPTALELARHGAYVILACRDEKKGTEAQERMLSALAMDPDAGRVEYHHLDISSLASVASFAESVTQSHDRIDLLINNAGILGETYASSADGFERQFATNYLGHFALTARLLPLLQQSQHARVVVLSSMAYTKATFDTNEIMTPVDKYDEMTVYAKTKLYNMLFMVELNRRLQARGVHNLVATAAHPGFCATNIAAARVEKANRFQRVVMDMLKASPMVQTPEMGALPTLYAATEEDVKAGDYYGPRGVFEIAGHPTLLQKSEKCEVVKDAAALWEASERLAQAQFQW